MPVPDQALQAAYLGEVGGERFFLTLAECLDEGADALRTLARLERQTGRRMASLLHRRGIPPGDEASAAARAEDYARSWRGLDWQQALARLEAEILPFVPQFDALAEQADDADRDDLDALAAHERALLDFTRVAQRGDPSTALSIIHRLLNDA